MHFLKWTLTLAIADFTSWPALNMVGERGDVFPLGLQQLASQFMCVGGGFYLPGNPPLTHPSFGLGDFGLFCCLLFHSCYYALSLFYIFGNWLSVQKSDVLYIKKNFIITKCWWKINFKAHFASGGSLNFIFEIFRD